MSPVLTTDQQALLLLIWQIRKKIYCTLVIFSHYQGMSLIQMALGLYCFSIQWFVSKVDCCNKQIVLI